MEYRHCCVCQSTMQLLKQDGKIFFLCYKCGDKQYTTPEEVFHK